MVTRSGNPALNSVLDRYRDRLFHPPTRRDSRGEVPRSMVTACPGIERTDTVVLSEFGCPIWRGLCLDVEGTDRSGELILLKLRGSSRDVGETPYLERSRSASQTDDSGYADSVLVQNGSRNQRSSRVCDCVRRRQQPKIAA